MAALQELITAVAGPESDKGFAILRDDKQLSATKIGKSPNLVAVGNRNGDNSPDVAVTLAGEDKVKLYNNDGNGDFGDELIIDYGDTITALALEDISGNGFGDVFAITLREGVSLASSDGRGGYSGAVITALPEGKAVAGGVADIDGDGDLDGYVAVHGQGLVLLLNADGKLTAQDPIVVKGTQDVLYTNLDGDKYGDFVTMGGGGDVAIVKGRKDGFEDPIEIDVSPFGPKHGAVIDDTIVFTSGNELVVLKLEGSGSYVVGDKAVLHNNPTDIIEMNRQIVVSNRNEQNRPKIQIFVLDDDKNFHLLDQYSPAMSGPVMSLAKADMVPEHVGYTLQPTDLDGTAIASAFVGDEFYVNLLATDLRDQPKGVFGAYADVEFPSSLAEATSISFGELYPHAVAGTIKDAKVDELGGTAGSDRLNGGAKLVASIKMKATKGGEAVLRTNSADILPIHATLLYDSGEIVDDVKNILYGTTSIVIEYKTWQNPANSLDVNDDGDITAIDVLQIVNELNDPKFVDAQGLLPVKVKAPPFLDPSGDGYGVSQDALLVINYLNNKPKGEGEAVFLVLPAAEMRRLTTARITSPPLVAVAETPPVAVDELYSSGLDRRLGSRAVEFDEDLLGLLAGDLSTLLL